MKTLSQPNSPLYKIRVWLGNWLLGTVPVNELNSIKLSTPSQVESRQVSMNWLSSDKPFEASKVSPLTFLVQLPSG